MNFKPSKVELMRPSQDEVWMDVARVVATRSTCLRRRIGAVITLDDRIISSGYNGACRGHDHCTELGFCVRDKNGIESGTQLDQDRAVHAEQNAILNSPIPLWSTRGHLVMYVTTYPCPICAKLICQSGIKSVFCFSAYSNHEAIELFSKSGVMVQWMEK